MINDLISRYRHIFGTDYTADANCKGAWLCDEGSGEVAADSSASAQDGAFDSAGHPAWASGSAPKTYVTNYVNFTPTDKITITDSGALDLGSGDISFGGWAYADTHGGNTYFLGTTPGGSTAVGGLSIQRYTADELYLYYGHPNCYAWTAAGACENGEWHHIFGVRDSGVALYLYVDGIDATAGTNAPTTAQAVAISALYLGDDPGDGTEWDGKGCEFAVFDRLLSSVEINAIMDNGLKGSASCALTGTITTPATDANIIAGGMTIILTLSGDTWATAGANFDSEKYNLMQGITSAGAETLGWNNEVRDKQDYDTAIVRTNDTVVTITLLASADYRITADETITVTIPASILTGGVQIVAAPTFTIHWSLFNSYDILSSLHPDVWDRYIDGVLSERITSTSRFFYNLPTSDPGVAGQLWNSSGTLKVSAG